MLPLAFVAVSVTVYVPGVKYVAVGLRKLDVEPFPKFHDHEVGLFVERSVKFTMIGEQPERGVPVKLALGT